MSPNKAFFSHREKTPGAEPVVWILLKDAKVATQISEKEMLANGMYRGCFIHHSCHDSREAAKRAAFDLAKRWGCEFVSPDRFREIEAEGETSRVSEAFAAAEAMIAQG